MNINEENYELYLYRYAEGLLTDDERRELEAVLPSHPEWQELLDLYDPDLKITAQPQTVFPDKESLKHKPAAIFPLYARIAVAASVALLMVAGAFFLTRNKTTADSQVVAETTAKTDTAAIDEQDFETTEQSVAKSQQAVATKLYVKAAPAEAQTKAVAETTEETAVTPEAETATDVAEMHESKAAVQPEPTQKTVAPSAKTVRIYSQHIAQNGNLVTQYSAKGKGTVSTADHSELYDDSQSIIGKMREKIKGYFKRNFEQYNSVKEIYEPVLAGNEQDEQQRIYISPNI